MQSRVARHVFFKFLFPSSSHPFVLIVTVPRCARAGVRTACTENISILSALFYISLASSSFHLVVPDPEGARVFEPRHIEMFNVAYELEVAIYPQRGYEDTDQREGMMELSQLDR